MQQVELARPDLAGQFNNLPALPPQAEGLTTVLANMASLAQNLGSQGVNINDYFNPSDPEVASLLASGAGRRLLQVCCYVDMHAELMYEMGLRHGNR